VNVVVSVGTDHHPFDRLLAWMRSWPQPEAVDVLVQTGETPPIEGLDCRAYLTPDELDAAMDRAIAVVCHGGPGTILQARHAGHLPVVVPRRSALGEHVDDHQVRFARWMADRGQVVVAEDEAALHAVLDAAVIDPSSRRITPDVDPQDDVAARFGDLVDVLVNGPSGRAPRTA
jgi:UDP-N-acetylglucosamine transferase subunit ALG13